MFLTRPLHGVGVPVVKGAAERRVLARLQHDVAAYEPPHRASAVGHQTAQRWGPGAVVGDAKHQHTQVQQVALGRVPAPEDTQEEKVGMCDNFNSSRRRQIKRQNSHWSVVSAGSLIGIFSLQFNEPYIYVFHINWLHSSWTFP